VSLDGPTAVLGAAAFAVALLVAARRARSRSSAWRYIAAYSDRNLPYLWRLGPFAALFYSTPFVAMVIGIMLPPPLALGAVGVGLVAGQAGVVISYWTPTRILPPWLRDEIAQGTRELARPDHGDWAIFWIFFAIALVGDVSFVLVLILGAYGPHR